MARTIRNAKLDTRSARAKLAMRREPYWVVVAKGCAVGYRKMSETGTWVARYRDEAGKQNYQALGAADDGMEADNLSIFTYAEAQRKAEAWFKKAARAAAGHGDVPTGPYTVADAMRDYLVHYAIEGKGLSVAQAITNGRILPALGNIQLEKLTTKRISDWLNELAASPARLRTGKNSADKSPRKENRDPDQVRSRRATANRIMAVLKAALNYAWREGRVSSDDAWRKVKPFKNTSAPVIRYLSEAECVRLVNTCPEDLRLMVQAALFSGCRYGELANLKASDVNLDAGTVAIRTSKSGKPRHVVLTDESKEFFETLLLGKSNNQPLFTHANGSLWGKSHQHRPLQEACARAKIEPAISFHVLRHTHGSLLAMQGVPLPVIAKQLGHADTRMTEKHYAHLSPSYVAETIRQKFPALGIMNSSNVRVLDSAKKQR